MPGILLLLAGVLLTGCQGADQQPDPVLQDLPIAYVKRNLPVDDEGNIVPLEGRELVSFNAGGDVYIRDRASAAAEERNITATFTGGEGDVRDLEVSYDGSKLLFAMRAPEIPDADENEQPTWNIWEYEIASQQLRRVMPSDIDAEAGQDLAPHYLPDGRIVFTSTRQQQAGELLLNEGKSQFTAQTEDLQEHAALLHVMEADGDGDSIRQISLNQSHDLDPTVLPDGKILFSRWDNMGSRSAINLYTVNPDGSELSLVYGAHSHETGTDDSRIDFIQPRPLPDGSIMATMVPFGQNNTGGNLLIIDQQNFIDYQQPTWINRSSNGVGHRSLTNPAALTNDEVSPAGRFLNAFPLQDGTPRVMVSWSPCRVQQEQGTLLLPCTSENLANEDLESAPPLFGIYIYNYQDHTQLPIELGEEGMMVSDVVVVQERDRPFIIPDKQRGAELDADLYDEGVGLLHIRSVYDIDGTDSANPDIATLADPAQTMAADRPARFIRITKAVAIPDDDTRDIDNTAFGTSRQQLMREIIGYAMVEPDGSVKVKVPANTPLTLSILDQNGRRIGARHQNWLQVRPGEVVECNGCHNHTNGTPHAHAGAAPAVNGGAATTGLPFPNTVATLWADMGETMAEARTRTSCVTDCSAYNLAMDINYTDLWTDPVAAARAPDDDFAYRYSDLDATLQRPTTEECQTEWQPLCRIVINYAEHIHPLWSLPRVDGAMNDITCSNCHRDRDDMNLQRVPDGQLDLSDGDSSDEPDHFKSYRELLVADNEQELVNGALTDVLQDILVQDTDDQGNPLFEVDEFGELILDAEGDPIPVMVTEQVTVPVPALISTNGARSSAGFFEKFEGDSQNATHKDYLTPTELRLISEWLDIGAQYYNDPFQAPVN